jgi:hypothetical protein
MRENTDQPTNGTPVRTLPPGHLLFAFDARQIPAPGAIYRALMPGDLETLFGPVMELRDREFLLEIGGQRWFATPAPGICVTSDEDHTMVFDAGGIYARTSGEETVIDFELLREAGAIPPQ